MLNRPIASALVIGFAALSLTTIAEAATTETSGGQTYSTHTACGDAVTAEGFAMAPWNLFIDTCPWAISGSLDNFNEAKRKTEADCILNCGGTVQWDAPYTQTPSMTTCGWIPTGILEGYNTHDVSASGTCVCSPNPRPAPAVQQEELAP